MPKNNICFVTISTNVIKIDYVRFKDRKYHHFTLKPLVMTQVMRTFRKSNGDEAAVDLTPMTS